MEFLLEIDIHRESVTEDQYQKVSQFLGRLLVGLALRYGSREFTQLLNGEGDSEAHIVAVVLLGGKLVLVVERCHPRHHRQPRTIRFPTMLHLQPIIDAQPSCHAPTPTRGSIKIVTLSEGFPAEIVCRRLLDLSFPKPSRPPLHGQFAHRDRQGSVLRPS